jgi:hypothetical protein
MLNEVNASAIKIPDVRITAAKDCSEKRLEGGAALEGGVVNDIVFI